MRPEVKNLKIAGLGPGIKKFEYLKPKIMPHIETFRNSFSLEHDMHPGPRFHNDKLIFARIATAMFKARFEPHDLSFEEKRYLVHKALAAAAYTDYWYRFEKEYD